MQGCVSFVTTASTLFLVDQFTLCWCVDVVSLIATLDIFLQHKDFKYIASGVRNYLFFATSVYSGAAIIMRERQVNAAIILFNQFIEKLDSCSDVYVGVLELPGLKP